MRPVIFSILPKLATQPRKSLYSKQKVRIVSSERWVLGFVYCHLSSATVDTTTMVLLWVSQSKQDTYGLNSKAQISQ